MGSLGRTGLDGEQMSLFGSSPLVEAAPPAPVVSLDPAPEEALPQPPQQPTSDPSQLDFFGEFWQQHWKGMPEFVQPEVRPLKSLYVHFEKREDVEAFAALIGQTITMSTRFVWFPELELERIKHVKFYTGEPEELPEGVEVSE